jgi:DNA-binding GntR family transcriptional regulator
MASYIDPAPWWRNLTPSGETHHYIAIRDQIASRIETGILPAGAKLPSERQLQDGAGIARGTIREALFQLEAEGLIYRRDRSGWYVCPEPIVYDPTRWSGFMTYVSEQGRQPQTQTLARVERPAGDAGRHLGVTRDAPLYQIDRRRLVDGRPVLVERILVNPAVAPGLFRFSLDGSLTRILKAEYGVVVARNQVDMRPCALVGTDATALGVKSGTPGLKVVRSSFDSAGRVVEYDQEFWRHDAVRVHVDTGVCEG